MRGLTEAARQAGLATDWRLVTPGTVPPGLHFQGNGPARFWLFTLKALAFIALRAERVEEARELLDHILALDVRANVGGEVIATLLASLKDQPRA